MTWSLLAVAQGEAVEEPIVFAGVLLSLVAIYIASKIGGEISNRLGFPPVLGELIGGVLIGISALKLVVFPGEGVSAQDSLLMQLLQFSAGLSPAAVAQLFQEDSQVISVLSELGVFILLFEIGLESNLSDLLKVGTQAVLVAVVGVVVPFAAGTLGLMYIFHLDAIPAVFAGAALTATSIGITSRVLAELGQLTTKEGQIILGAAVVDDVLGIIVLAVVASLASTGEVDITEVGLIIASAVGFLLGVLFAGGLINSAFLKMAGFFQTRGGIIVPALILAFILGYLGTVLKLEAILGAFAAGLVLDETDKKEDLEKLTKPIADILVPVFFVVVGARTDLNVLNPAIPENRTGLIIATFLITVAILGKMATGLAVFGKDKLNRLAIGVGMIPRGEVGLVFAAVGTASGTLTPALDVAIILMVIFTTFLAPPLLRFVFPKQPVGA
ncbi:MAG: cation:proton antiporter [Pseudanabaenaceae cyanobacterium SKYGB_i_bin29]|nr:cation:proton antiporter [Pseudanabaenaceae cyanobacterium SKYG29]MDW8421358.1 cation:proton antiporter [Pseudanabaenaceae cyanobacterium SKYGB_i_bin29]